MSGFWPWEEPAEWFGEVDAVEACAVCDVVEFWAEPFGDARGEVVFVHRWPWVADVVVEEREPVA